MSVHWGKNKNEDVGGKKLKKEQGKKEERRQLLTTTKIYWEKEKISIKNGVEDLSIASFCLRANLKCVCLCLFS